MNHHRQDLLNEAELKENEYLNKKLDHSRAYKTVFGSEQGQLVLEDLAESCSVSTTVFDGNPHIMSFKEGRRSVILDILKALDMDESAIMDFYRQKQIAQKGVF